MFGGRKPVLDRLGKRIRRHAGMGRHHEFDDALLAGGGDTRHITLEQRCERLLVLPLRMFRRHRLDAIRSEHALEIVRLLGPERAVIVEDGDPFLRRHEVRPVLAGDARDEIDDGRLCLAIIPGRKIVGRRIGRDDGARSAERRGKQEQETDEPRTAPARRGI
ncbi:hypothetical protein D9M70_519620 [compost metagenome]